MRNTTKSLKPKVWQGVPGTYTLLLILLFFIPSLKGNAQTTVTIGTGTSTNSATGYPAIFGSYYYGNKIQILYEASELLAGGATANSYINSVAFDVGTLNSVPTLNSFTVKVYTTSASDPLATSNFFDGSNSTASLGPYTTTLGWNTLTLATPILWNGCDNIIVEVCSQNSSWTSNGNAGTNYSSVSGSNTYVRWYRADSTTVCSSITGSDTSTNRPNIQFNLTANTVNCGYVCFSAVATSTSVVLSWTGTGTSYVIEYGLTGFTPGTGTTITTTNLTETISSLTANTTYDFYIEQICTSGPSAGAYGPVKVTTPCGITGDFHEGFETTPLYNYPMGTPPTCWSIIYTIPNTWSYTGANSWMSNTGSRSMEVGRDYGTGDFMLVSPETDNLGNGTKRIRFSVYLDYYWPSAPSIQIYTLDGPTASATKTLVETIALPSSGYTWEEYTVILPNTTDDYFAFSFPEVPSQGYAYYYIDDVYYEEVPVPVLTTFIGNHNICYGGEIGTANVEVTDGYPPFTYEWLPSGGNAPTASGLAAGVYTITVTDALSRSVTDTITITEPAELLSNIVYNDISCNGNADGSATISPSGGVTPYTVLWSTGATGNSISNLVAGNYTVTITDGNDCEITESFDIIEPTVFVSTPGNKVDVSVNGGNDGSASVIASGGTLPYTYSWSPSGGNTDTASNLTAGTYTVTITDAGGCTNTETFVITEPQPLTIHLVSQTDVSCNGNNDGEIIVNVTGDHPPFTYVWTPGVGNATTAPNLSAGNYTLAVTDAIGETTTRTFTITEPDLMVASVNTTVNVSCYAYNDGSATATVTGGTTPYTYTWSNGETGAVAVNLPAGNHSVVVTDANGCKAQQTFTIDQPTPITISTVSLTDVSCNGMADGTITIAVNGGFPPYTYSWSNGQTGTSLTNLSGGNYIVTVTDISGCTATEVFTIVNPALVYPPVAVNQGFCSDDNPQLSDVVITGSNIQWYDAVTGGNQLPLTTALTNGTTYYASQTVNGCESNSRAAVLISLSTSAPLATTAKDVCFNSRIQDVTIDGFSYNELRWYSSATSTTILASTTALTTGTYYISSFTNNICESARQAVQITVLPNIPAPTVTTQVLCGSGHTLNDLTVGQTTGTTLNWYTSAQATTPVPGTTPALSGIYYVEQAINSCTSTRVAVPVQIIPVTSPAMTSLTVCGGTTIADYNQQVPTKYVWYVDNTTTTPLAETTLITSGTFYIAEEISGCISNRAQVNVIVNQRPNSPTGQTIQRVPSGSTVANLQMNQPGVIWFASESEALTQTNQLSSNTVLIDGAKYYGILSAGTNCGSLPTEVTVEFTLSTNNLDLAYLKYYPNPTDSELNISYVEAITKVEIFNIAGQKVLSKEFDANEVKVDLSGFGSGTYMVRIETETASQFVKVVKK